MELNTIAQSFDVASQISIDNAAEYLLRRGLLTSESIINSDLIITEASRKNKNIKVTRKSGIGLFLKQALPSDQQSKISIKREALLYALMQTDADFGSLKDIAPLILDFDHDNDIMITEILPDSQSLNDYYYSQTSRNPIEKDQMVYLGKIIASYHSAFKNTMVASKKASFLPRMILPFMSIARPRPEIFVSLSSANLKLLKIIQQQPLIFQSLEELYLNWSSQTLVHGDLKWDNIIISNPGLFDKTYPARLSLVDWESANFGDPAWDVGSILQELVRYWLYFLPTNGLISEEKMVMQTSEELRIIQDAARAFWISYSRTAQIEYGKENEFLARSIKYCAARLLQTAFESLISSSELSNIMVYMIQTAANIFSDIDGSRIRLFGIPFRGVG